MCGGVQLSWTAHLLVAEVGIVGGVEPIDEPHAAVIKLREAARSEHRLALVAHAGFYTLVVIGVLLFTGGQKATVLLAELVVVDAPLTRAPIVLTHPSAWNQQIELPLADVADIGGHDNHGFAGECGRARVTGGIV